MLFNNKFNISERVTWFVIGICVLPIMLNLAGFYFGSSYHAWTFDEMAQLKIIRNTPVSKEYFRDRLVNFIFTSFAITIAFLNMVFAFIEYKIKRDVSTPIVGVALFCSGMMYVFHFLTSIQNDQNTLFTWFFCRLFHASILLIGACIFLLQPEAFVRKEEQHKMRFIIYISAFFVIISCVTIVILKPNENITQWTPYSYSNYTRTYDLITLAIYVILGFIVLPKFYAKFPSSFSQMLGLSMLPAIAAQIYLGVGSLHTFDNGFNISQFMMAFTYLIPFAGLGMNYLQTHKNEKKVNEDLHLEAEERRHTEALLSGALNTSQSGIMAFKSLRNKEGRIVDFEWLIANPASEKITGIPFTQVSRKKLSVTLPFMKEDGLTDMLINTVEHNEALNYEYFSKSRKKWLQVGAVKMEDGFAVTINDISRRKNALEELLHSEKLVMTGRIARGIAHEVRNPLTNIQLSLHQLNGETGVNEDAKMYADIIRRNAERINQLINELLSSSRPAELNFCKYPVHQLLEESVAMAKDRLLLKGIKVERNYSNHLTELFLDPEKVKTALLNIIINAIEVMEPEKGVLKIGAEDKHQHCLITIQDNGKGISEENISKLFDPFYSAKPNGMGLGLTSARNIIMAHQGTIEVESTIGIGTKFIITLKESK